MSGVQDKRFWLVGGAAAVVIAVGGTWFGLVSPVLSDTSDIKSETQSTSDQNFQLSVEVAKLARQDAKISDLSAELTAALAALPSDNGLPAFTRQLSSEAQAVGVHVNSITVGGVTPSAGGASTSTTSSTNTSSSTTTEATSSPASSTSNSPGGIVSIQVTISTTGPAARQLALLRALQVTGPRRALVTAASLSSASSTSDRSIEGGSTMSTTLTVFAQPRTAAQQAALQKLQHLK